MSHLRPIEMSDCPPSCIVAWEADDFGMVLMSERDVRRMEVLAEVISGRRTVASAAIVLCWRSVYDKSTGS